ncbi:MAG TPA: phospholipase D-like domain-containing protein [bacterium]|nr:phospholipase D-like domain-containing protein [bacterium]HOL48867.1 phospholipase D-like domain-containing protein [bacterium]HPQ19783.1 phospholipase D-like domain-containing protein [bacterium]
MKKLTLIALLFLGLILYLNGEISVYFTDPFTQTPAYKVDQKLYEFLSTAESSIKIAIYQFDLTNIRDLLKNLQNDSGISIEIVYDPSMTNDNFLTPYFPNLVSYTGSDLMHHKFAIVDGKKVWTGSFNWSYNATNENNENAVIIENEDVANNYRDIFEQLYSGDFGEVVGIPEPIITIDDNTEIQTYFSPKGKIAEKITKLLDSATHSIYFCMFTFSNQTIADKLVSIYSKKQLSIKGIIDVRQMDTNYNVYKYLTDNGISVLGGIAPNRLHHKFIIIDPGSSDAKVITGSYNLTAAADENNNENIVIIKNKKVAEQFLLEFNKLYSYYSPLQPNRKFEIQKFYNKPNPANTYTIFVYDLPAGTTEAEINIFSLSGEKVRTISNISNYGGGINEYVFDLKNDYSNDLASGLYFVELNAKNANGDKTNKITKLLIRR